MVELCNIQFLKLAPLVSCKIHLQISSFTIAVNIIVLGFKNVSNSYDTLCIIYQNVKEFHYTSPRLTFTFISSLNNSYCFNEICQITNNLMSWTIQPWMNWFGFLFFSFAYEKSVDITLYKLGMTLEAKGHILTNLSLLSITSNN